MYKFNTPVLFLIFNRTNTTEKVFSQIAKAKPAKLYIASDGHRKDKAHEEEIVRQVREFVISGIGWDCEVKTLFRSENLGCKLAVSSAIDWFFENEDQGIILEDDCLPDVSFFPYCETLLNRYKDDERIMHIAGTNIQNGLKRGDGSYYYSKICHIWGWATWRRAWMNYDVEIKKYPLFLEEGGLKTLFQDDEHCNYWKEEFDIMFKGNKNTWDYQWLFSIWANEGLCIAPQVNLVSNIGFGINATHTFDADGSFANRPTFELLEITAPTLFLRNYVADLYSMKLFIPKRSIPQKIKNRVKRLLISE